jgi:hypothetical protein
MADSDLAQQFADFLQGKNLDEVKDALKNYSTNLENSGKVAFNKITDQARKTTDSIKENVKDLNTDIRNKLSGLNVSDLIQDMKGDFLSLADTLDLNAESLEKMAISAVSLTTAVKAMTYLPKPEIFANFGTDIKDASDRTAALTNQMDYLLEKLHIDPKGTFGSILIESAKATDSTRRMENAFVETAAASGQLGNLLNEAGQDFADIDKKLVEYADLTKNAANATGMNTGQVSIWAGELAKIPGALSSNIVLSERTGREINVLTAALQTASGAGLEFKDVFSEISNLYNTFGEEGGDNFKNSLQYISSLSQATQDLKIPLEFVKNYTDQAAQAFKFFGNNSQAAINIISRLGPALKDTGLGPAAISEMTRDITDNIAKMGLAERSFLSSQSGGAGGLKGGYQIELLKSQGKIDEIEKMAEKALRKQFGGRIVTLDEGAKDEGAVRQLTKQVQLVTQGPNKIVNSEAEAYKLFEAMKKGISSPGAKDPSDTLNTTIDRGQKLQERGNTILTSMLNELEELNQVTQLGIGQTVRGMIGPGEGKNSQSDMLQKSMDDAANAGRLNTLYRGNRPGTEQQDVSDVLEEKKNILFDQINKGSDFKDVIKEKMKGLYLDTDSNPFYKAAQPELKSAEKPMQKAEISVMQTCPDCQRRNIEVAAARVFDNKIELYDRGKTFHNHTGSPTSTG